jgi:Mn-containing catalase
MYHHIKELMYTVDVGTPDPAFGNMLLEQFGGANGELPAAMQYSVQGINCDDPQRKDLLMDIGTEELSHLEIVGALARLHLRPLKDNRRAAEARAKIVYERLIQFTDDVGSIRALQFLMTREITHMKAFTAALESMGKNRFAIGGIPPTPELVNQYFDDSTGTGDRGEPNASGPWNTGGDWEIVEAPALKQLKSEQKGTRLSSNGEERISARVPQSNKLRTRIVARISGFLENGH